MYYELFNNNKKYYLDYIKEIDNIIDKENVKVLYIGYSNSNIFTYINNLLQFINLEVLYCNDSKLTKIPLLPSKLKSLNLNDNKLTELPDLTYLTNLEFLYCGYNELIILPNNLPNNLISLHCYFNNLTNFPDLSYLNNLNTLYINNNQITEIYNLHKYKSLKNLLINNTLILTLPKFIIQCKKLYNYKKYNGYKNKLQLNYILNCKVKKYYYYSIIKYYTINYLH